MIKKNNSVSKLFKFISFLIFIIMLLGNVVVCKTSTEWPCSDPTDHFTYPKNAPDINVFHMVVIGDSIAWGEGLNQEEKYYYLVAKWLNEELHRPINVTVYAHNAAKLESNEVSECTYPECPNSYPSILKQADLISNLDQVDLILVSAGINDVDVLGNVGNIDISSSEIRRITRQEIQKPMTELLNKLLVKCENTKIIVTGYYRIITDDSHNLDIGQIYPKLYKLTHDGNELPSTLDVNDYKPILISNSEAFWDESDKCLRDSVNATNSDRVAFAPVDFPASKTVAASDTWLWNFDLIKSGYNILNHIDEFPTTDPKYDERKSKCSDSLIDLSSSFAHPNIKGAQKYKEAIVSVLTNKKLLEDIKSVNDYIIFPYNAKKSEAYHIAVIGDSIAWGNGLEEQNKYCYQVAEWLYKKINIPVDVTVYAHSGASISGEPGESIDPSLNSKTPTLMQQAKNIKDKDELDLILVSGGINDVGIGNILDANTPSQDIVSLTESINASMKKLLTFLVDETDANIIVTGYYPIITEDSKVEPQDRAIAGCLATLSEKTKSQTTSVLLAALSDPTAAKAEAAWYLIEGIANNIDNIFEEDANLRSNSDIFYSASAKILDAAAKDIDKKQDRVMFVDPMFGRNNSYRASDSFLWVLKKDLKTNDDRYEERAKLAEKTYALDLNPLDLDLIKQAENKINPIAHPNVKGANKYAHAIESVLHRYRTVNISALNTAGSPADGVKVILNTTLNYTADSKGKLVVLLLDGNYTINASKPDYGTGNWSGFINSTQNTSINITLKPPEKHLFTVTTLNSAYIPMTKTDVYVDGKPKGRSGPDGNLTIELVNGDYTIHANNSGYGSGEWTGILDNRTNSVARVVLIGPLEYTFNIITNNSAGYPMEGTNVTIDGEAGGLTDMEGKITAMLVEGNHTIYAVRADYGYRNWTGILDYNKSHEVHIDLNGPLEYPFNISVINAANYSIEGAVVSLAGVKKGSTDRAGRVRAFLLEGNQTIRAVKDYYGSANWTGELNHTDGKDIEIKIDGALEYPFNVTVTNSAGNMIQEANVSADGRVLGITDINGYLKAMLTDGNHTLEANKTGYDAGNWTVQLNYSENASIPLVLTGSTLIEDMQPIDLCLVLDTSGSMADQACKDLSKIQAVKNAAQDTIASFFFPGTSNRVAIVSFCHYPATVQEFTNNYRQAYDNVSYLSAGGATSFGTGLAQAVEEFRKLNQTNHVREIIFMSDGMHNTPPDYRYYIGLCRIMGIRVYTVGYGSEADHDLLKLMAALSGGEYVFADPCGNNESGIRYMFMRQQMNLSGSVPTIIASGEVEQNQTVNATYFDVLTDSKYPVVTLIYPGSHLNVSLVGPDGRIADPKEYVYTEDKREITVRLKEPMPGNWTVQVFGHQVNGTEPYTVYVSPEYKPPTIPDLSIKSIRIKETSGETLREHPVQIPFNSKNFPSDAEEDGSDINIFDQNGKEIPRWIEEWDRDGKKGSIWVKVPEIPADGEIELLLLTGNPGVPAENNGSNIFDFFDDFEDREFDANIWSSYNSSSARIEQSNGTIHIYADEKSNSSADFSSEEAFSPNVALRFRANVSRGQGSDYKGMGFLRGDIGHDQEAMQEGVYWLGREKNLFIRHKYSAIGMSTLASGFNSFKSKYDAEYKTWQIKWFNSSIDYELDGITPSSPTNVGIPEEPIKIGFSINTTHQAYPSEIILDWVMAYIPAKTGPKVTIETE
jgi:lysophospholipase L1-like esterase